MHIKGYLNTYFKANINVTYNFEKIYEYNIFREKSIWKINIKHFCSGKVRG